MARRLKTFVKNKKRYRVVFSAPTKTRVNKARKMYDNKITAIHYDNIGKLYLIGVR